MEPLLAAESPPGCALEVGMKSDIRACRDWFAIAGGHWSDHDARTRDK